MRHRSWASREAIGAKQNFDAVCLIRGCIFSRTTVLSPSLSQVTELRCNSNQLIQVNYFEVRWSVICMRMICDTIHGIVNEYGVNVQIWYNMRYLLHRILNCTLLKTSHVCKERVLLCDKKAPSVITYSTLRVKNLASFVTF